MMQRSWELPPNQDGIGGSTDAACEADASYWNGTLRMINRNGGY